MNRILNLIYPSREICHLCKSEEEKRGHIGSNCLGSLDIVNGRTEFLDYIDVLYYSSFYNRFIREKIKDFKFHNKAYLYKALAGLMLDTLNLYDLASNIDMIIYIPSYRTKKAKRGYNQSELLARYISRSLDIPLEDKNLFKIKHTKNQSDLSRLERASNLRGAFELKYPERILNRNILLVDDIITTGATLMNIGELLKKNGAKEVFAIALASTKTY